MNPIIFYDNKEFAKWFKKLRIDMDVSQQHMAAILGYSGPSYLSQIECGRAPLTIEIVNRIIERCELDVLTRDELVQIHKNNFDQNPRLR